MLRLTIRIQLWLAILLVVTWPVFNAAAGSTGDYSPGDLVCAVTQPAFIDSINIDYGTTVKNFLPQIGGYLLEVPNGSDIEALALDIALRPDVLYCEPNFLLDAPEGVQSSQGFIDEMQVGSFLDQNAAALINLAGAHDLVTGGNVSVGIIDAGVNMTHPDLTQNVASGFDYVDNDSNAVDEPGGRASGHGTFVAGLVSLVAPDADLISYRVLDTTGRGNGYTIAEALLQAVADGCRAVNLSIVMTGKHSTLDEAISFARDQGVVVTAAAGNDSTGLERFPAKDSYTLAVAGVDSNLVKADFSNFNGKVDICAPATRVYAPYDDSMYAWWDGTSFAAPFVAGLAALLYERHPGASWDDIINSILEPAVDIDSLNEEYAGMLGSGLIDPVASLRFLDLQKCGDIDGNGQGPDISDLIYLVDYMFNGGAVPPVLELADLNGDGVPAEIGDLVHLVDYMFSGGLPPACDP
ncbi:MAG: S8 family serine peptidase [candidate division Zixibacteria bacterium]|nr:S8 family serine peptidase [candidate division Zixibacteria bacterium]MDH3935754.1 S8 family serine peptidase [candidate division Zixibacteria bacterium]MDH4032551.1 S8 family serine peptidase [candidate division Zixibacteria bacterium]